MGRFHSTQHFQPDITLGYVTLHHITSYHIISYYIILYYIILYYIILYYIIQTDMANKNTIYTLHSLLLILTDCYGHHQVVAQLL
jgi:hypothetical protein